MQPVRSLLGAPMRNRRISFDQVTVYCNSTTAFFFPIGPWMDASDITDIRSR